MSVLYIALPVALVVAAIAIIAFVVQVNSGQYDDLETPAHRMLVDDEAVGPSKKRKQEVAAETSEATEKD